MTSVGASRAGRGPGWPGLAPGVPRVPERTARCAYGGADEGGRSELPECRARRASSAVIRAACCWMTASRGMINGCTTRGVCSQPAASSGSPAGMGRDVATASPSWLARHRLQQRLGLLQVGGVKALGEPAEISASSRWASARLPCCCHNRLRLIAARSSSDLACCRRATSRAC